MSVLQLDNQSIRVSVVVPTRNRLGELKKCLTALRQQNFPKEDYEIIVCDDGSVEDVKSLVLELAQGRSTWRYLRQNPKGPGAARNLGIKHAYGAIVAMTDSDTLPEPNWLIKLWEALERNQNAVAVEGRVYAQNEGEYGPLGEGPTNKSGGVYLTCNCAYRREVLLKVGGFDESFPFPAYEDTELAARVQQFGPIVWQPDAVVVHPERALTTRGVIKKLHHWEYVLIMGFRYGYLAWRQYPVKYPRVRVALLSTLVLPAAKFGKALSWLGSQPIASFKLALFGLIESLGATLLVAPKALFANYSKRVVRKDYLGGLND
jgi:GT2 family glycosyltransferase